MIMSGGGEIIRRRRSLSLSEAPAPLDNDDILGQILIRLSPQPSSLPRASLVCKRWHRLVSDPGFLRSFRAHHRKPPILGFFSHSKALNVHRDIEFTSVLDPPDRIPAARFFSPLVNGSQIIGCRHGRVLVINRNRKRRHFIIWDPVTGGDQREVGFPPPFRGKDLNRNVKGGAIVCASGDQDHVHGACHSSPFQVVLLGCDSEQISACVYSSETKTWGNLTSMLRPLDTPDICADCPNTLVGNSIYWLLRGGAFAILEFDLGRQSLAVIEVPQDALDSGFFEPLIMPVQGGGLGFLALTGFNARIWKRETSSDGVIGWVLRNTVDLKKLLGPYTVTTSSLDIVGLAEEHNSIFLWIDDEIFMVHLELGQVKKLPQRMGYCFCYPFASLYTAGCPWFVWMASSAALRIRNG